MSEWISVNDRLPLVAVNGQSYECVEVIVTDGQYVEATTFKAGGIGGTWSEFDGFGAIARSMITHWMSLPEPPK